MIPSEEHHEGEYEETLHSFLEWNKDSFSPSEVKALRAMNPGDTLTLGGGAFAETTIRAVAVQVVYQTSEHRVTKQAWNEYRVEYPEIDPPDGPQDNWSPIGGSVGLPSAEHATLELAIAFIKGMEFGMHL
jgi:hypothetical protein|tara:strand:+ start:420 stop:812 length:393 start_codon:yes stop_codon:yes gene_type:complete